MQFSDLSFWERNEYLSGIDFLIIGAGIVGNTTAFYLKQRFPDAKILVLERCYLPSGASTKNAGFACFGSPTELYDDLSKIPENEVFETLVLRYEGLQRLFSIVSPTEMNYSNCASWDLLRSTDSELSADFIHFLNEKMNTLFHEKEVYSIEENVQDKFGFQGIKLGYKNRLEGSIDTGKLMFHLHRKCMNLGIQFLFGINVTALIDNKLSATVETSFGEIKAQKVFVCTNGFGGQLLKLDVKPARAQVLVTEPIPDLNWQGTFHYDSGYFYFRNVGNRILIGGGRNLDFDGETTYELQTSALIQNAVEQLLKEMVLPWKKEVQITHRWAGIMGVGETKKPIVQPINDSILVGVRMGGMGVAIGSQVGYELSKLV